MSTLTSDKRKNGEFQERRVIPWWLILLVGFALGIVFTLSMSIGRGGTVTVYSSESIPNNFAAQATLHAQAAKNELALGELDPLLATATAIVSQATQQAFNQSGSY
jgi:hypothetical protein